ncbi:DUF2235 domain-containing protein [Moraxella bovis]|uniref:DUF2235 domain-containing protein n=1 Tax=Moraxella bovis TaxID=476 RepID=A0AAX3ETG8_MORBO|nr:DUF2235 domain-containing protein [Moraxella bovis]AWY21187.1 hypothetical protein DQF64_12270 [Moraxella bovis]UYZ81586.1 DUF2235 domain-containing protein [Moraxella bovis]UYZ89133.1 DUF2235 domain-containing protein [Moraxella bovis]UYZ95771.1 DUF2235 domain-containing protein [Moraxella bovis]UZA03595.1 DUF2235 domain-containing protein [Moraxella bovis]
MANSNQSGSSTIKKAGTSPIGSGVTTKPTNTSKDVKIKTITIHIFFDGTGNNIYNSAAHRDPELKHLDRPSQRSYTNYYSNIALLFEMMDADNKNVFKFYVEGSGTTQYQDDSPKLGMGAASGNTGRVARHNDLIGKLHHQIKASDVGYANVIFNVYGFSRGAAWSRSFCHTIKKDKSLFKNSKINFVGILDTVSSDGIEHYDDVKELGLDIGKLQDINYIFHLTAQNDYRKHFPLTRIKGAIKDGIGFECSLPGAHSDIGGGYPEEYREVNRKLTTDYRQDKEYIDYNWFVSKGYYTKKQLTEKPVTGRTAQEHGRLIQVYAKRTVKFHYQFICFEILKAVAIKKAGYRARKYHSASNPQNKNKKEHDAMKNIDKYLNEMKSDKILNAFYNKCYNYILANYTKKGGGYAVPLLSDDKMKYIYGTCIHNSLEYGDIANKGSENNKINGNSSQPTRPMVIDGFRK